jgi:Flp pilus assembly protein TadB
MESSREKAQRERAYQRLFQQSFKRLEKQGQSEHAAGQIARQVAEESLERAKAPVFRTEQEYSDAISRICRRLGEGTSHYALIGEMPYLATGRLDRVTSIAKRVQPPVDAGIVREAKKVVRMERLSAGLALFFMGLALGTLGLWYAIAVGAVVAIGAEIYAQKQMPASLRRSAADLQVPLLVNVAAAASLAYFGYRWITDDGPRTPYVFIAAVALFVIAFVIPGLTLARLVSGREKSRRKALEQKLPEESSGRPK